MADFKEKIERLKGYIRKDSPAKKVNCTEDAQKKQARLQEESISALLDANKKMILLGTRLEDAVGNLNAKYAKVCAMLGGKDIKEFIKRVEETKSIEERIKRDLNLALAQKIKETVEEELEDATVNLKKISELAYKKETKPEDIERMVESKIAPVEADCSKIGKALGILQRIVQEEHVRLSQSIHKKIEDDIKPVLDELADLREDIEQVKNLKGDLVDDVNRIIAGYEDKNKIREVQKLENAEDYGAYKMDALEDSFNKKLVELMHRMDGEFKKTLEERSFADAGMDDKLSMLERQNQALRLDLEELKKAYFQIMKLHQSAPIIIE